MNSQYFATYNQPSNTFYPSSHIHKDSSKFKGNCSGNRSKSRKLLSSHSAKSVYFRLISSKPMSASSGFAHKKAVKENHALEKQNILFQISKEKETFQKQKAYQKKLQFQLQREQKQKENKVVAQSIQENFRPKQSKVSENIFSKSREMQNLQNSHVENLLSSIQSQTQKLLQTKKQNELKIEALKKSDKYTKFLELQSECQAFGNELRFIREEQKQLKRRLCTARRVKREARTRNIEQLILEGQIEDQVERQNIELYQNIEALDQQLSAKKQKCHTLLHKKALLVQEVTQMGEKLKQAEHSHQSFSNVWDQQHEMNMKGRSISGCGLFALKEQENEGESYLYDHSMDKNQSSFKVGGSGQAELQTMVVNSRVESEQQKILKLEKEEAQEIKRLEEKYFSQECGDFQDDQSQEYEFIPESQFEENYSAISMS